MTMEGPLRGNGGGCDGNDESFRGRRHVSFECTTSATLIQ
jgi:hypothetical protein